MLKGFVIAAPPPLSGVLREFTRVLSPQNFLLLLGLTAVAALILVGPARRRLAGLEAAALRVAGGNLGARAADDGRDEVSMVARAFNHMSAELAARDAALQAAIHSRRQLFADVSHELKTPLTSMRGYLETLQMDDGALPPDRRHRYLGTVLDETHAARTDRRRPRRFSPASRTAPGTLDVRVVRAGAGVRARDAAARARDAAAIDQRSAPTSRPTPISSPAIRIASNRSSRTWSPTRCATCPTAARSRSPRRSRAATPFSGWPTAAPASRPSTCRTSSIASTRRIRRGRSATARRSRWQRIGAVDRQGDRRAPRRPHRGVERAGPHGLHRDAAARQRGRRRGRVSDVANQPPSANL